MDRWPRYVPYASRPRTAGFPRTRHSTSAVQSVLEIWTVLTNPPSTNVDLMLIHSDVPRSGGQTRDLCLQGPVMRRAPDRAIQRQRRRRHWVDRDVLRQARTYIRRCRWTLASTRTKAREHENALHGIADESFEVLSPAS